MKSLICKNVYLPVLLNLALLACAPTASSEFVPKRTSIVPAAYLSEVHLSLEGKSYYMVTVLTSALMDELQVENQGITIAPVRRMANRI
jgi:hypothetical protein